ncbi:MAG: protein translocase subunit SecF [Alphaproteobacteria bacterium]|nr:protein translocase subunit SecF [Alphaproteobacteria bacterium]MBL0717936.1 protein translocase subunit SecF [Alphaproteobacteria bacterium]
MFNVMKWRKVASFISVILISVSIFLIYTKGINVGLDFTGGVQMNVSMKDSNTTIEDIQNIIDEENIEIQKSTTPGDFRITVGVIENPMQQSDNIKEKIGHYVESFNSVQVVGPKFGQELVQKSVYALILSLIVITIYVSFRFSIPFALGAIFSILHDVILLIGFFVVTQFSFTMVSVALFLMLLGYSINDTIVNYDRIRENLSKVSNTLLSDTINQSVNQMMRRTIYTSITVIASVLPMAIWGTSVLQEFGMIIMFGIFIGVYSSIFVANAILIPLKANR